MVVWFCSKLNVTVFLVPPGVVGVSGVALEAAALASRLSGALGVSGRSVGTSAGGSGCFCEHRGKQRTFTFFNLTSQFSGGQFYEISK